MQVHGGLGYMHSTAAERIYRDSRLYRLYEGTSEIQKLIIARISRRHDYRGVAGCRLTSCRVITFRCISFVPSPTIISGASRKYRSTSNSVE